MEPGAYMSAPPFPPPHYKHASLRLAFLSWLFLYSRASLCKFTFHKSQSFPSVSEQEAEQDIYPPRVSLSHQQISPPHPHPIDLLLFNSRFLFVESCRLQKSVLVLSLLATLHPPPLNSESSLPFLHLSLFPQIYLVSVIHKPPLSPDPMYFRPAATGTLPC